MLSWEQRIGDVTQPSETQRTGSIWSMQAELEMRKERTPPGSQARTGQGEKGSGHPSVQVQVQVQAPAAQGEERQECEG